MTKLPKLVLGGAQIGQPYGTVREASFLHHRDVDALLTAAWAAGFRSVDTARAYGDSERQIGNVGWLGEVHTKLEERQEPIRSLITSLELLRRETVDVLYLCHDADRLPGLEISEWKEILESLESRVGEFGLSLYANQLDEPLADLDEISVVQVPINVLSGGLPKGLADQWKRKGKKVIARSVFAQGLLLRDCRPTDTREFVRAHSQFRELCRDFDLSPGELALRWVLTKTDLEGVVVGVSQLDELPHLGEWIEKGKLASDVMATIETKMLPVRRNFDLRNKA